MAEWEVELQWATEVEVVVGSSKDVVRVVP